MSSLKIYQLNSHNAIQANTELLNQLSATQTAFIALIQEPYLKSGKIIYPTECTKLEHGNKPRTAIYVSKQLNFSLLPSLSNQFCTAIAGSLNNQKIVIASIYLHSKQSPTPDWLQAIIKYCHTNKYGLLIGADANCPQ